ncbi:MAG TPA: carboxypeptidase-like regulatory domain-containing protein [Acidisarcina sp.]
MSPSHQIDIRPAIRLRCSSFFSWGLFLLLASIVSAAAAASGCSFSGALSDTQGKFVPGATITLHRRADSSRHEANTGTDGQFSFAGLDAGEYRLTAESQGFAVLEQTIVLAQNEAKTANLQFSAIASENQSVTVTADVSDTGLFVPDPAQRVMIRDETLDANPGRPGMPISIPGMPVESPAGGVKPPQYFVPGVAGDHGEPIAMFFQVGGYLFQNNLPANAHGNGYADPNVIIPIAIESVQTDGGAFNVREGNNSENAAIVFGLRDRVEPMVRLTGDYRNLNLTAAWSPANPADKMWLGGEVSYGNGFLKRLEHRKQYKGNVSKIFDFGQNQLTVYGIGYYGFAFQPGLIPINVPVAGDTIDPRQQEETSNGALIFNDIWHMTSHRQLQFSGFYRYYTLDVRPNFAFTLDPADCSTTFGFPDCGNGLIRQSEHRNVNGEEVLYAENYNTKFSLLAGADFRREAPSALDLDRADSAGKFQHLTANNVVIDFYSPFVASDGTLAHFLHYNLGYRRDEVSLNNQDIYRPFDSFSRTAGVNSPKGTITLLPPETAAYLPTVAYSYGQSFHVNDPRIGATAIMGTTVVSKARSNQLVISKYVARTDLRLTLEQVTTSQSLGRVSNDTGLQEDEGPGIIKSLALTARHNFSHGFVQALYARADAHDRNDGTPTPEAPRLIWDVLATIDKLPAHLVARGEYEQVGIKPLGDRFNAVPVREFRGAIVRPFDSKGIDAGVNFFVASGYGGQTLETLALPGEGNPFERVTGFPLRSYVTASVTYHFRRK